MTYPKSEARVQLAGVFARVRIWRPQHPYSFLVFRASRVLERFWGPQSCCAEKRSL